MAFVDLLDTAWGRIRIARGKFDERHRLRHVFELAVFAAWRLAFAEHFEPARVDAERLQAFEVAGQQIVVIRARRLLAFAPWLGRGDPPTQVESEGAVGGWCGDEQVQRAAEVDGQQLLVVEDGGREHLQVVEFCKDGVAIGGRGAVVEGVVEQGWQARVRQGDRLQHRQVVCYEGAEAGAGESLQGFGGSHALVIRGGRGLLRRNLQIVVTL